uniref:PDEase domain-containing protein n=1 Tax=Steinernema glaseri TaxID=37863 RepID=A0A1I8A918_9BILA
MSPKKYAHSLDPHEANSSFELTAEPRVDRTDSKALMTAQMNSVLDFIAVLTTSQKVVNWETLMERRLLRSAVVHKERNQF